MSGTSDIAAGRLPDDAYCHNFADLHPPLDRYEARVAAERCFFCYDAPCMTACPTGIDIPIFIRQIAHRQLTGAAKTILDSNIMGGMCARVCPTEMLCEQACVRKTQEDKPVEIGLLQRYATDALICQPARSSSRAGRADRQARRRGRRRAGRPVLRPPARDARPRGDAVRGTRQARRPQRIRHRRLQDGRTTSRRSEVECILGVGGIEVAPASRARPRHAPGRAARATTTRCSSASGSAASTRWASTSDGRGGVADAVDYIAELRQATTSRPTAGRPPRRRHRRRHDRDRHRRARPSGSAPRTSPSSTAAGPEQMSAIGLRAGMAQTNGVLHPPLGARRQRLLAEGGQRARRALRATAMQRRPAGRTPAMLRPRRPTGVQGHRPELRGPADIERLRSTLDGRPHRGRCRTPHLATRRLGRRRLRRRRPGSDGRGRRGRQAAALSIDRTCALRCQSA